MKIYDVLDKDGRIFAFEINNFPWSRQRATSFIATLPGVEVTRWPRRTFFAEDDFCEFIVAGRLFYANEPFGDNSRYWISTRPPEWCKELEFIRSAFANYKPWWLILNF